MTPDAQRNTKVYVQVKVDFREDGIMLPRKITWEDGREYEIDRVVDIRQAAAMRAGGQGDRYTIKIAGFKEVFGVSSPVPSEFDGIPVLNNQKATFYWFEGGRGEHDIDNLWGAFTNAIDYADNHTTAGREQFIEYYDAVIKQKGVKWNITMGLFWIRPYSYINLDSRNRWFISNSEFVSREFVDIEPSFNTVPSGEVYLDFCRAAADMITQGNYPFKSFPEMSAYAWASSLEDDEKEKDAGDREKLFRKWMAAQPSERGTPNKSPAISANATALRKVCTEVTLPEYPEIKNLFDVTDIALFERIREAIMSHPDYEAVNRKHGNGYLNTALTIWYDRFLKWLADGGDPDSLVDQTAVNALSDDNSAEVHYWLYSPGDGAAIWEECYANGIMALGWDEIGDLSVFSSKEEMKSAMKERIDPTMSFKMAAHATWQFTNEMKPGDVVFAKKGLYSVVGRGIVESDYERDDSRANYKNIRHVKWTDKGEWPHPGQAAMKALTDITPYTDYVSKLNALFVDEIKTEEEDTPEVSYRNDEYC